MRIRTFAFSTVLLLPMLPAQQAASSPEDLLPASSYACLRFGGLDAAAKAADQLAVGTLLQAVLQKLPADLRGEFVDRQFDRAATKLRDHLQQVGLDPAALRTVLGRPMVLGVGRLTIEGMGPSVALLVDCRQGREQVHAVAKVVHRLLQGHLPGLQVDQVELAGQKLHRLRAPGGQTPTIYAGDFGDCYVLSNSRGYLEEIAAVRQGRQPSLAQQSLLGSARQPLPAPALASLFLNPAPLLNAIAPLLPYEMAAIGDALGVTSLGGLYAGATAVDGGSTELLRLGLGGNEQGALKAAFHGGASFEAAKWCSGGAVAFAAGSLDLPAAWRAFGQLLDTLPLQAGEQARRQIGRGLRQAGVDQRQLEALLAAFGPHVAMAVDLGALLPEPVLFVEIGDWQQVEPLLQMARQQSQAEWKTRQSGDDTIHYCNLDVGVRLSPCYVRKANMLVIGTQVQRLLAALEQQRHPDDSLFAQPDFAAAMRLADGACGMMHVRGFRAAELGWRTVEQWAGGQLDAHTDELGFGSEVLPDQETVAKALGCSTVVARVDQQGVSLQSRGNFGLGCLLAALGRAADEVLARAGSRVF